MSPKHVGGVVYAMLLIGVTLSALPSGAQDIKSKVRISYPSPSICCLSLFAAHQWKVFERNGLSVEIVQARSQAANAALMSGDINYVAGVGPNSVVATLRGMPTRAIWFASNKSIYSLVSKTEIQTLKDLRTKKIGISGIGGTAEVSLKIALEAVKENPKNFVYIGLGGTQLLPALAAGTVDAVELNPPYIYFAKKNGYRELLDVGSLVEMPIGGLTATVATIRNKPDEVRRVIRSIQQAKDLMLQQRTRSIDLISKFLSVDRESAEDTFGLYKSTVSETGVPTNSGMDQILRAIHMLGQLTDKKVAFTDIADDRIAKEVAKELGYKVN
jgi:ABC-type nitrate/sulfonate/bicarbonate transport system substrate-binding protein